MALELLIDTMSTEQSPIPGYELVELQQRNGHLVYLARDTNDRRLVRLSVVNSAGDFGRMVADGLRQQAAVLATLDHPNILRTLEVGDADGRGFFSALEYAGGGDLRLRLRTGPLLWESAAKIAHAISGALQYARERGAVQKDLSPTTILFADDNTPKLIDFRLIGDVHNSDVIALTIPYAAPEELLDSQGGVCDSTSDVYRIGAILYAMLTGRPPFSEARNTGALIQRVLKDVPAPVRQRNDAVPGSLEAVCMKCLEKAPASRYPDAGGLAEMLREVMP